MPMSDPCDRCFFPHHTPMKDTYCFNSVRNIDTSWPYRTGAPDMKNRALSSQFLSFWPQHVWKLPERGSSSCYLFSLLVISLSRLWPFVQLLTYRLIESMGLGGPRWPGSSWQWGIAVSGSSWLSTLMIETPGDMVWDLPCVQQASNLEGDPLMWMLSLYLHVNQNSGDDDDIGKIQR